MKIENKTALSADFIMVGLCIALGGRLRPKIGNGFRCLTDSGTSHIYVEVPYVIVEVPYVGLVVRAVLCIRHSDGGTTTTHPYTHPPPPWSPPPRPST